MTISFYTLNIHQPLQQMLYDADDSGDWTAIINYCAPLIDTTEEDSVILCYAFALMEQAISKQNDVENTGNQCLALMKKLKHTYGGTDYLVRAIKKEIRNVKTQQKDENKLNNKPFETLTTNEKSKLAFNLHNQGGIENCKKAAEIYLDLLSKTNKNDDASYNFGNYVRCLFGSNQTALANEKLEELLKWDTYYDKIHFSYVISNCFQAKIVHYKNDAAAFQQIWNEAVSNEIVKKHDNFPTAYTVQDELLIAANELGLNDIKTYLIDLIKKERKPRLWSDIIRNIILQEV